MEHSGPADYIEKQHYVIEKSNGQPARCPSNDDENLADEIVKKNLGCGPGPKQDYDVGLYAAEGELKEGAYAGGGVGAFRVQEGAFAVEGRGPNAGMGVGLTKENDVKLMAKVELASVSESVGPAKATLGLSADTGGSIGKSGVEAKFLGTGFSVGRKVGISFLGSGFELKLW